MSQIEKALIETIDNTFYSLMRFTKKQIIEESIEGSTISPPQFGVLHCLKHEGQKTMSELSSKMQLSHGSVTGLIDRLFKLELVERIRSQEDRRVVYVCITPKGEQLIATLEAKRHQLLVQIIGELNPQEQDTVLKAMTLIREKLIKHVETP